MYNSDYGLLSATESYNNKGEVVLHTAYVYDQRGHVIGQNTSFTDDPSTAPVLSVTPSFLIYHYNLQGQVTRQQINAYDATGQVQYFYTYDGLNRMREIKVLDNGGSPTTAKTIVKYDYDDALGVLTKRTHQLNRELVVTNYTYDDRMRLKDISSNNVTDHSVTYTLMQHTYYHDGETPTYLHPMQTYVPQFGFNHNGNINGVVSSYDFDGVHGSAPALFEYPTVYGYKYDKLNRLVAADGLVTDFVVNAFPHGNSSMVAAMQIGDESYVYDKIGNINQLQRVVSHADLLDPTVVSKTEGWNYAYNSLNRLTQVNGVAPTTNRSYTYDANGNLLTDSYRNIGVTEYGRAAYSYEVVAGDKEISYLYSIDDQRMYKKVVSPTETTREFYLQDIMGRTVAIRKMVNDAPASWEYYVNGTEREAKLNISAYDGNVVANDNVTEIEFYLHDHLGNTRIVYEPTTETTASLHLRINYVADYFPYGKILREYVNASDAEKFLTTQHERDQETGLDYRGARYYDSDIARFLSIDPLANQFPAWSPYVAFADNPIRYIDPDGRAPQDWVMKENGTIYWDNNANDQASTKQGETYLGKELNFVFNSYIDKNLWDGPMGSIPAGDKLTSTITLKASENAKGEMTDLEVISNTKLGDTPVGTGRAYYPGKGGLNFRRDSGLEINADGTVNHFKVVYEQHASVSSSEEAGLRLMGYKIVDVAQKLVLIQNQNYLWVGSYTNIFPSATLTVNGHQIMYYAQPSFKETHQAPIKLIWHAPYYKYDFNYYPSKFYPR